MVINKNFAVILSERRIQLSAEQQSDSILYELVTNKALTKQGKSSTQTIPLAIPKRFRPPLIVLQCKVTDIFPYKKLFEQIYG